MLERLRVFLYNGLQKHRVRAVCVLIYSGHVSCRTPQKIDMLAIFEKLFLIVYFMNHFRHRLKTY